MASVSRPTQLTFALETLRDWTNPRYSPRVFQHCGTCGNPFWVQPSRLRQPGGRGTYCSKVCAYIGQPLKREPWMKGLTVDADSRVADAVARLRRWHQENPGAQSGKNNPFFGKKHTQSALQKNRLAHKGKKLPPEARQRIKGRADWSKGKTKETDPRLAKRGRSVGDALRGKKRPDISENQRRRYAEHPEQHPNHRLARKGHETHIERAMRIALTDAKIPFERQYRIKRFWVDFAIIENRIVVEVDGTYWHDAAKDALRDAEIEADGWRVLRFNDRQVIRDIDGCLSIISTALC
jgi:very-short-patch-repair endonuclease